MIFKLTLCGLVILLIAVIAISYYTNKEGFADITANKDVAVPMTQAEQTELIKLYTDLLSLVAQKDPKTTDLPEFVMLVLSGLDPLEKAKADVTEMNKEQYISAKDFISKLYKALQESKVIKNGTQVLPMTGSAPSTTGGAISQTLPESKAAPALTGSVSQMPKPLLNSVIPERTDVVPEVSVSESGYNAMALQQKMDLLKDIQKVVRNELIATRNTEPVGVLGTRGKVTDSTAQGKEYEDSCYKDTEYRCPKNPDGTCPPIPDMSKYIKKDEIPCWGCSIDY